VKKRIASSDFMPCGFDDRCERYSARLVLKSAPRTRLKTFGARAFSSGIPGIVTSTTSAPASRMVFSADSNADIDGPDFLKRCRGTPMRRPLRPDTLQAVE